jgi:hypothetical protein
VIGAVGVGSTSPGGVGNGTGSSCGNGAGAGVAAGDDLKRIGATSLVAAGDGLSSNDVCVTGGR